MGYLFFSVRYPSDEIRAEYLQAVPAPFRSPTFALYQPLPASATIEQWKELLPLLQQSCSAAALSQGSDRPRPLKPNDDNYQAFTGPQWKRYPKDSGSVPPEMAALVGSWKSNDEPTPHYDHCAYCTKSSTKNLQQCSRCKIVQYCSRDCQAKHWKACHKQSCMAAEPNQTLWQALQTNDGFYISPIECQALAQGLEELLQQKKNETNKDVSHAPTYMMQGFYLYFRYAADLGGCFVL